MPRTRPFAQVDVFGSQPYRGNPLAVVLDADGLSDEQMQRLALWTNLSETSFVLPATTTAADYRVRIFTPSRELPFAGHPTLGTAHAWLEHGGSPRAEDRVVQECAAGLIEVRRGESGLAFAAPPLVREGPLDAVELDNICEGFGIARDAVEAHQWVDNGPGWAAIRLASAEDVLALEPDWSRLSGRKLGVVGFHPQGSEALYETRALVGDLAVEDPVTGSLNASLAQWLVGAGEAPQRYVATQGTRVGREGIVAIDVGDDGAVWVGGATTTLIRGTISL
ncbi:PhzF family phenazine biosynthesis protein [Janibacter limosus]|uniref:PhzF family phenazine biosynthesis protein n=1 Tax=Janibacter limosus TaxID=53458 RepID=UPI000835EBA9|nr:PhzF family phenazine biosynthesis protein [Janibacter limosus]